jgi:hypothetical protein
METKGSTSFPAEYCCEKKKRNIELNEMMESKMIETMKPQSKKAVDADSKPARIAKLIYRGIERYIKAENARNREKNYGKTLDFSHERRVNRERKY